MVRLDTLAEVDKREQADFTEDDTRGKVKAAKKGYDDALGRMLCRFLGA